MKKAILFCCFCLAVINFTGCEGPAGPEGPYGQAEYSVFGEVSFTSDTLPTNAYIFISNISSIPTVKLNQDIIKFRSFYNTGTSYRDTLRTITEGDEVHLTVSGNQGVAGAVVRIPQQFTIQSPDPDTIYVLPSRSDFTVSWTNSNFTDYYDIYFILSYRYAPIGEETEKYFHIEVDTILSTTSLTIPASRLFPADFDSVSGWSYGYFQIAAINGPRPEVGTQGNVTGDGFGFFFGRSDGGYLEIIVQNSSEIDSGTKLKSHLKREQSERFYRKFLKWQKMNN